MFQKTFVGGTPPGNYVDMYRFECYFQGSESILLGKFCGTIAIHFSGRNHQCNLLRNISCIIENGPQVMSLDVSKKFCWS